MPLAIAAFGRHRFWQVSESAVQTMRSRLWLTPMVDQLAQHTATACVCPAGPCSTGKRHPARSGSRGGLRLRRTR